MTGVCNDWKTALGREARESRMFELLDDERRKKLSFGRNQALSLYMIWVPLPWG